MMDKKKVESEHRRLCMLAAKWLYKKDSRKITCNYVAIELVTAHVQEIPDVFGWCYWTSVVIEVKTSRSDFLKDKKKPSRITPELGGGEYRYYCCPKGLISPEELPENWGLLYEENGVLSIEKAAERQKSNARVEMSICASIMRREGLKPKIYDYRK